MKNKKVKIFSCENCNKSYPIETANKQYSNDEVFYVCDKCVKNLYKL